MAKKKETKQRKEVLLTETVINNLQGKADKDGRSLKNYMEKVLIKESERN